MQIQPSVISRRVTTAALYAAGIGAAWVLGSTDALAALGVGGLADNVAEQISPLATAAGAISWMAGLGFGIASVFKFKQHSDNPQQTGLKEPIMYLGTGAGLIMIPEFMGAGIGSIFGGIDPSLSADGTAIPSITSR